MNKKVIILGAGISGLSAAKYLFEKGYDIAVYEKESCMGGLSRTFQLGKFRYDIGPHYIYFSLAKKAGLNFDECQIVHFRVKVLLKSKFYPFPFIFINNFRYLRSILSAFLKKELSFRRKSISLDESFNRYYGSVLSQDILIPLVRKWQGCDPQGLSACYFAGFPCVSIKFLLNQAKRLFMEKAFRLPPGFGKGFHYVYPRKGISTLCEKISEKFVDNIYLNSKIEEVIVKDNKISAIKVNSRFVAADSVISTIPITELTRMARGSGQLDVFKDLKYRCLIILALKIDREKITEGLWNWFPEERYPFYRISEPKNGIMCATEQDKTLLTIEITCGIRDELWLMSKERLKDKIVPYISEIYGVKENEILDYDIVRIEFGYPVYLLDQDTISGSIDFESGIENLYLAGRNGRFRYFLTESSYDDGLECGKRVHDRLSSQNN